MSLSLLRVVNKTYFDLPRLIATSSEEGQSRAALA